MFYAQTVIETEETQDGQPLCGTVGVNKIYTVHSQLEAPFIFYIKSLVDTHFVCGLISQAGNTKTC